MSKDEVVTPHVLIFPLPLQGPVNCMLKVAELFAIKGLRVTFLNTFHIQNLLLKHTNVQFRFDNYPEFHFETIPDGLSEDHPRSSDKLLDLADGIEEVMKPLFKEMLIYGKMSSKSSRPVTLIIADGGYTFPVDIAKDIGIPVLYFDTISPCALWTYFCLPTLIELGEVPFKEEDYDRRVTGVGGTENFLRCRDLPSFFRTSDLNDRIIQFILQEIHEIPRSQGMILNTSEHIDGPIISQLSSQCPNIYPIGPLHALYKSIQLSAEKASPDANFSNSLWEDDKSCMAWYDRVTIEKTVREVMEDKKDEFEKSSSMMAKLARQSVGDQGASSHSHFNRLVEDIRMMRLSTHSS
ncbi:7-deoxyloganetic acid glucosyltransferase [Heracleum sosnowskyi]|uniref:7-deoxyloganetic acid glucosyltransferase n=1 Tax=Heracleum sosnowskyi TaxID=360622 RepID=A0AAD8M0I8_9APIA|nr:7-deoxyloganetic acid glucosyltransferase [Heracleum sosnowskyi]